ncbi:serpin family protein [Hominifimenecus sp. rT4P-3]|uniref:serpin family protein n=1 Tax=Hominifimenecus sp. rT4P-3 TaxID=3242979 RepID=UPI003DA6C81A
MVKKEELFEAIGGADDELLERAEKGKKRRKIRWGWWGVAAACFCIVLTSIFWKQEENGQGMKTVYAAAIAEASYPEMATYPNEMDFVDKRTGDFDDEGFRVVYDKWKADRDAQLNQPEGYDEHLDSFFAKTIPQFLSGAEGENKIYSPLNVYLALSMLAELTDGESREQILEAIGADSIETLRSQVSSVWNANYCRDGAVTSLLANSLWLNQDIAFRQSTMDILAKQYYASSFQGEMGSDALNQALQTWLNDQTGGLLKEQASGMQLDSSTILALASTIYFQAKWDWEFSEGNTKEDVFHAPDKDVTCDFMHQNGERNYYWGEGFAAVPLRLEESGNMWLILPDEGVSPESLLSSEAVQQLFLSQEKSENQKHLIVNLALPKFDVASDMDLISGLKKLGIANVFDPDISDFSPMTSDTDKIFVSQAKHAARVMIDEQGCTAAAYTVMAVSGAGMPPDDEVDFVLNRPFLFAITSEAGMPLFVGIVNQP